MIAVIRQLNMRNMAHPRLGDLFGRDEQPDLFGAEPVPAYRPDPDKVRRRLHKILAEARTVLDARIGGDGPAQSRAGDVAARRLT